MADEQIARDYVSTVLAGTQKVMYGLENVIQLILIALYTNGHVLLEGNPGLGKTALVKTLSKELGLEAGRIQFTPDLLPSDIITKVEFEKDDAGEANLSKMKFSPGPVFTSLLLADEINRATPKTQSALLQAMAERSVTFIDGTIRPLNDYNEENETGGPFMVLATQNPVEHEGTFNLPEAQLDRFMFKIVMPMPSTMTLLRIMKKEAGQLSTTIQEPPKATPRAGALMRPMTANERYWKFRSTVRNVLASVDVETHINELFMATNRASLRRTRTSSELNKLTEQLRYGLGPRAARDLLLGAKGWKLFFSTGSTTTAQADDLAMVILPVLRHRLKVEPGFLASRYKGSAANQPERWMDYYIRDLALNCAPKGAYREQFQSTLDKLLSEPSY